MAKTACPLPKNYDEYLVKPVKVAGPFTTQHILFIIAIAAAGIALSISLLLIMKHLHRYTEPKQQRQIIRIIFTPVVFSVISALSILNYSAAKFIQPLMDLWETVGLASVLLLFINYVAPDERTRLNYFAQLENRKPKSFFRPSAGYTIVPGGSLFWFFKIFTGPFLYLVIDILMTIIQIASEATGDYCESSWSPRFAHVWLFIITNFFLGWAVNSVVLFYLRMKSEPEFAYHKPGLKLLSFKLIIGINFLQSIFFQVISVHTDDKFTEYDLRQGCPYALMAIEQIFFAIFFHYAFRSREYHESEKLEPHAPRIGTFRAAANAFNPSDLIFGMVTAVQSIGRKIFGRKPRGDGRAQAQNDSHLEPMTQQPPPYRSSSPYQQQSPEYTATGPQETSTANSYRYVPVTNQPQANFERGSSPNRYDGYEMTHDESQRLNPHLYPSHSRSPSAEGDARSARQMV